MLTQLEFWSMVVQLLFAGAFGACAGSLINVLAYRMPLGISVVHPPSRCPSCHTRLTWRENIPVFGWILLRGRCRFCKSRISAEYPIVEASVAGLFVLFFFLYYCVPFSWNWPPESKAVFLGIDWAQVRPEWTKAGFSATWALFVMLMVMVGTLVAMTICDAKTMMIPLQLPWTAAVVGMVTHLGVGIVAQWYQSAGRVTFTRALFPTAPDWSWAISSPGPRGWWLVGVAMGGAVGLVIANVLLWKGLIRRSFADYNEWEASVRPAEEHERPAPNPETSPAAAFAAKVYTPPPPPPQPPHQAPTAASMASMVAAGPSAGVGDVDAETPADMWLLYPYARREMVKEIVYLAPAITLALLGGWLAVRMSGPWIPGVTPLSAGTPAVAVPLWLDAFSGSVLGFLVGGGVVWLIRILGSLAFGKEAMGLGDVHLMAGVGACVGWVDSTLAFFLSAFVGLGWTAVASISKGKGARSLPLGPSLALATILVLLLKPVLEWWLGRLAPGWAPINLP